MIEVRMSRELALQLGAIEPKSVEEHKTLRASGKFILVRDRVTLLPMFWQLMDGLPRL